MQEQRQEQRANESSTGRGTPLPRLKSARKKRGLTQRELAERAGVSPGTVNELETGRRGGYPTSIRRLANALGINVEDLVE
jgi:HTH-type transcriptional regulator/antitoxin HipB